jgi:hypothetical protein
VHSHGRASHCGDLEYDERDEPDGHAQVRFLHKRSAAVCERRGDACWLGISEKCISGRCGEKRPSPGGTPAKKVQSLDRTQLAIRTQRAATAREVRRVKTDSVCVCVCVEPDVANPCACMSVHAWTNLGRALASHSSGCGHAEEAFKRRA